MGTVHSIYWNDGVQDSDAVPAMVLLEIPNYTGIACINIGDSYVVPILPKTVQWEKKGRSCQRRQFPINMAFAMTVHKSQGLNLDRVVVNLTAEDFTSSLT